MLTNTETVTNIDRGSGFYTQAVGNVPEDIAPKNKVPQCPWGIVPERIGWNEC